MNADPEEAAEMAKTSKRENRVYVGNLSYEVRYRDLMEFMRRGGLGDLISLVVFGFFWIFDWCWGRAVDVDDAVMRRVWTARGPSKCRCTQEYVSFRRSSRQCGDAKMKETCGVVSFLECSSFYTPIAVGCR